MSESKESALAPGDSGGPQLSTASLLSVWRRRCSGIDQEEEGIIKGHSQFEIGISTRIKQLVSTVLWTILNVK